MATLIVPATLLIRAALGTGLRKFDRRWRWFFAFLAFALLNALWISGTRPPQSVWSNVPVIGLATLGSVFVGSREPVRHRPILAFIACLAAGLCGLVVGILTAIELGLLLP
jgi:hypothetical protein